MASAVVKFALEKVGNILMQEGLLLYGVRDDIEWLRDELEWMECFLIDAERKEKKGDKRVENWVMKVRDVAFEAEDVMDTFIIKQIQKRRKLIERSPRIIRLLKRYALYPFELKALHNIATQIARIRTKVRGIKESRETYGIVDLAPETRAESSRPQLPLRQMHPHLDDDTVVVGFGDHKKVIVDHLLDTSMERRCVISIVGMGGLGKTTLASKVYNEIKSNFATCVWITVSQEYNATELLKCIYRKVTRAQNIDLREEELVSNLYKFLEGKKYLIVMDDIWDTDVWALVKSAFPNAKNGSRVLFTTRFMDVAKYADSRIPPVELPYLSYKQSRELLLRKAFPTDRDAEPSCPDELEEVADELIEKCGGLPLALVVLGGLLSVKEPTFNVWKDMANRKNWDSTRDGNGCLEILALSYDDLPDHRLKSCFLYLGSFPEDSEIKSSDLVWQWIGEGFVASAQTERSMEETAMGYLDELAQRCMIQVVKRSLTNGRIRNFRIHDLLRDLCIYVARKNRFFMTYKFNNDAVEEEDVVTSRRLIVCKAHDDVREEYVGMMRSCRSSHFKARSLLLFDQFSSKEYEAFTGSCSNLLGVPNSSTLLLQHFFHRLRLLRVIHLGMEKGSMLNIPEEVGSLIHLRYLKVAYSSCSFPSSIGNLSNLQTLDVRGASRCSLPKSLWNIQTLAQFRSPRLCYIMPSSGIGRLKMLEILDAVTAGRWMRQLKELSSLRKLAIREISEEEQVDMLCDSLCKLDHLTSLLLQFHQLLPAATLFNSLPSHRNFRKLTLSGTLLGPYIGLSRLSHNLTNLSLENLKVTQEMVTSLEGLQGLMVLQIRQCKISEQRIYFRGGFPRLQHLRLVGLFNLRYLRIESRAMKDLTQLTINRCWELRMMPEGLEHLASLKKLVVSGVPDDFVKRIREGGEDFHKIQHIPTIHINKYIT